MSKHESFRFEHIDDLQHKIKALSLNIQLETDLSPLTQPVKVGHLTASNAFAVLPMEGCDSNADGSPTDLVTRRYERFSSGGAGLLWWEANAVVPEGRANPLQMMMTRENLGSFSTLMRNARKKAQEKNGSDFKSIHILQLTHSGRYSRPNGHKIEPMILQHDPILDPRVGLTPDSPLVSDGYLDDLIGHYVKSALLAKEAGFDGVDIKACHRYLISELLACHTRDGKYGGSFENRSRFLLQVIQTVKHAVGDDFIVASRFNAFDAHPHPYGFGCTKDNLWEFDPTEPVALTKAMVNSGVGLLCNSAGNPYYIYPQVTRPFDKSSLGVPLPEEHPLESMKRLFAFTSKIQEAAGDIPVVGNGYTWLRQFIPQVAAHNLKTGACQFVGLGRSSFAYPDAPYDVLHHGQLDPKKCCTTCSQCTQIMRDHGQTGCVIRDNQVYGPLCKEARQDALKREGASS